MEGRKGGQRKRRKEKKEKKEKEVRHRKKFRLGRSLGINEVNYFTCGSAYHHSGQI